MNPSAGAWGYEKVLVIGGRCLLAVYACMLDGTDMAMESGSRYAFACSNPISTLTGLAGSLVGEDLCNFALNPETVGTGVVICVLADVDSQTVDCTEGGGRRPHQQSA